MKSYVIGPNDAGQRLDKFITKAAPKLPKSLMYRYIRTKHIKVNGKRAEISTRLSEGDTVDAYINDELLENNKVEFEFLKASDKIDIVYEDENILLVDKKQGLLVHPDENEYTDTLISRIHHYLYKKGEYDPKNENSFTPALANRIDRNTGGIVIAAKNAAALRILCDKIKLREIEKHYLAVIHGKPKKSHDVLTGFLEKNDSKNKVYLSRNKTDASRTIVTEYTVLASKNNLTLIDVNLHTGRTHQIRAHMASIGHALLGDGKYGKLKQDKALGFNKQALYSYKLSFNFTTDADILNYLNSKTFVVKNVWFAEQLFDYKI
ncbi:MAG: RluA family pseudouridine synthase [Clostridia bacterium]|nr:RluA family pseudouridine synthase [Clostridia bacterium]